MDKNKYKETASAIQEYVCGQRAGKHLQSAPDIHHRGGDNLINDKMCHDTVVADR